MGANSKISWTDHTFNPWIGCSKVHECCTNCYAEAFSKRTGKAQWGPNGTRVKTSEEYWKQPLKWNREAESACERRRVFCASLADVFEEWLGPVLDNQGHELAYVGPRTQEGRECRPYTLADCREALFCLIDKTPWLDWLLLTKRPENIRRMWPSADVFDRESKHKAYWPNVWLGTSISDQKTADEWVPRLLQCRDLSPVPFLSCEPLLGPVNLPMIRMATIYMTQQGER